MLLDVSESYYMLCSVVGCYQGLLHACCFMCSVVTVLLHVALCC